MPKKLCKDTEIKAFSHWHFEISMARCWAVPVFSNEVWTVWSAYATADYPARPGRPHGQTYQHKSPLDNGACVERVGKNPQNEWARSLFATCLLSGISQAWPAGLRENDMSAKVRISRIMPQNVYTRPPFYSWEKFCVYTCQPTLSG